MPDELGRDEASFEEDEDEEPDELRRDLSVDAIVARAAPEDAELDVSAVVGELPAVLAPRAR